MRTSSVSIGSRKLSEGADQIVLDNGMSLAMAPEKAFVELIKSLFEMGFKCQDAKPLWVCHNEGKDPVLPSIEF